MRLLLAGGRHLDDAALVRSALDRLHAWRPVGVLIHGGLPLLGAAAEEWARAARVHVVRYPSNWRAHGRRAEAIRNAFMLEDSRPDLVLALPGGEDTGALVARARARGLPVVAAGAAEPWEGAAAPALSGGVCRARGGATGPPSGPRLAL